MSSVGDCEPVSAYNRAHLHCRLDPLYVGEVDMPANCRDIDDEEKYVAGSFPTK